MKERSVIWSFGGGVQSVAMLCLVAAGRLPKPERVVMANTARERASTWRYYREYARPVFESAGLVLEVAGHDLARRDLYSGNGDLLLPVYTASGKMPPFCSGEWKNRVVRRYLRGLGYGPARPVTMWIGISLDEFQRVKSSDVRWAEYHYPLCFDVPLTREDCVSEVLAFGLPEPSSSACWCCPNLGDTEWIEMQREDPADFRAAVALDADVRRRDPLGAVYLHEARRPLGEVVFSPQRGLARAKRECAGSCWT